jgi:hypothetical protein
VQQLGWGGCSMASAVASSLSVSDIAMSEKERIHSSEGEGLVEMGKSTPRREEDNVVTYHMIQVILLGSFGGFLFGCAAPLALQLPWLPWTFPRLLGVAWLPHCSARAHSTL